MDRLLIGLAFGIGLIGGPIVVARVWPERSRCTGDASNGECGASPLFWGVSLGLAFGYLVIAALILFWPPTIGSLSSRLQSVAMIFAMLVLIGTPLVICGFHRWRWHPDGVDFNGVFRQRSLRWKDISSVKRRRRAGWTLRAENGAKLSTSNYVPGEPYIIRALTVRRPDLAPEVFSALEAERV